MGFDTSCVAGITSGYIKGGVEVDFVVFCCGFSCVSLCLSGCSWRVCLFLWGSNSSSQNEVVQKSGSL